MRTLYPYRIRLSAIVSARGGLSKEMADRVLDGSTNYCNSLDDDLNPQDGWLPAKQILNDFLKGLPLDYKGNSAKHWYVIELLCNGFGKQLNNDSWMQADPNDFYDYDEFRMYYLGMDTVIRVPAPEGYPLVFTIENKDLEKAKLLIDKSHRSDDQKNQFIDWVQTTMDNEQDLILFCY